MPSLVQIESADRDLLASIAASMAEAVRRGGEWIACRPGCTNCCLGPFGITQLDALRLRAGLRNLESADPVRAEAVRSRAAQYVAVIAPSYPGDPASGALDDEDALPEAMDDVPCPALDPCTGRCDLYDARPIMCRTFGPVTRTGEESVAACELCYEGAADDEIASCAVDIDPEGLESRILSQLGDPELTIVAYALAAHVKK
jgi:Fe-S-cluster containining protein